MLALPVLGYLILKQVTARTIIMPAYFHDPAPEAGDSVLRRMPDVELTNQLGHLVTRDRLEGKILLVDFFYAGAEGQQPLRLNHLRQVQLAFAQSDSSLQILSISLKPLVDSVPVLKHVADRYHADPDSWWLTTGPDSAICRLYGRLLGTAVPAASAPADSLYQQDRWILVDKHGFVRGYFSGLDSADLRHCLRDISLLMVEREKH